MTKLKPYAPLRPEPNLTIETLGWGKKKREREVICFQLFAKMLQRPNHQNLVALGRNKQCTQTVRENAWTTKEARKDHIRSQCIYRYYSKRTWTNQSKSSTFFLVQSTTNFFSPLFVGFVPFCEKGKRWSKLGRRKETTTMWREII